MARHKPDCPKVVLNNPDAYFCTCGASKPTPPAEAKTCTNCKATTNKTHHEYPCRGCDLAQAPVNWSSTPPAPTDAEVREARERIGTNGLRRMHKEMLIGKPGSWAKWSGFIHHTLPDLLDAIDTILAALDNAQGEVVETRAMLKRIMDASRDKCWTCAYEENLRGLTKRCLGCDVETACKWRPFWIGI